MDFAFWQKIATTPWWMFAFVTYLFWASFASTKPRTMPIAHITFWPLVPVILSLIILYSIVPSHFSHLYLWAGFAFLGMGSGFLSLQPSNIRLIDNKEIYLPGSWWFFGCLVAALAAKLYFGFTITLDANTLKQPSHIAFLFSAYGLMTGTYIGRTYATRALIKTSSR